MASTYTTSLNLELQASGENSGTWGTKTNTNISLLETAICGGGGSSLAITATSQSLTAADGSADQARRAVLKLTGTLTGNTTLSSEAVEKIYWVDNQATMSTYTLTLAPAGGSGVSLASGRKHLIFQDGTNAYDPLADYGPINSSALVSGGNMTIGSGTDGTDYTLTFDGHAGDGVITWMEDEDYLAFSDDILMNTNEKVQFRDTGLYISSNADGDLDIVSDGTAVDSINLESAGGVTLDAGTATSGIVYEDDGTEMFRIYNSSSDVYLESKVSDKDIIIKGNDGGSSVQAAKFDISAGGTLTLGGGVDGIDYSLTFDGNAGDGIITWMEDEDYFAFSDDILMNTTEKVQFRDTGLYISSNADGDLDIVSDGTAVDSINLESAGGVTLDAGTSSSGIVYEDDGTEMLRIHNSSSDVYLESKVSDKDIYIKGNDGGSSVQAAKFDMSEGGTLTLGGGVDGIDYSVTFDGNAADGVITWMEDEDYFKFSDDVLMNSTERLNFGDTGTYIFQSADGVLDLVSDSEVEINGTTIDINGATDVSGTLTLGTVAAAGTDTDKFLVLDGSGNVDYRTGAQVLSDIGAGTGSVALTGSTDNTIATVTGANAITGEANFTFDATDALIAGAGKLQLRDSAIFINSSTDGQLDIDADTELEITAPTVDIDASSGVDISTDLTIGDDLLFGSSGAVINFNSGDVTLTHGSNLLTLDGGALDLDGEELVLDPDGDTSITADSDDQIDIKIAGADDFQFTANTFTIPSGSTVAIAAGGAITNAGTMAPAISSTGKVLALGI